MAKRRKDPGGSHILHFDIPPEHKSFSSRLETIDRNLTKIKNNKDKKSLANRRKIGDAIKVIKEELKVMLNSKYYYKGDHNKNAIDNFVSETKKNVLDNLETKDNLWSLDLKFWKT